MKLAIKAISRGNQKQMEAIKLMFLSKKKELVQVINHLKAKINQISKDTQEELYVRDAIEDKKNNKI